MLTPRQAIRRYFRRFVPSMAAYVILLIGSKLARRAWHPGKGATVALAVLPALPIVAVIWSMGMYLAEQSDEYQRTQLVKATLIGTALMLSVTTVWSFLEDAHLAPTKPVHFAFPLWCAGLLMAQAGLRLRERLAERRP